MKVITIKKEVKQQKFVVVNDDACGPVKFVSNKVHYFKIAAIMNCGSLLSFIQIDKGVFLSITPFVNEVAGLDQDPVLGHFVIRAKDQEIPLHKLVNLDVDFSPILCNIDPKTLEAIQYE